MLRKGHILAISVAAISLVTVLSIEAQQDYSIPQWVKSNALWWGQGEITDADFISGIKFLIDEKHMQVSTTQDDGWKAEADKLYKENKKLEAENKILKNGISILKAENKELNSIFDGLLNLPSEYSDDEYLDNGCTVDYPYLWSDGLCYTGPEYFYDDSEYLDNGCPVGYPYIWSDGFCYSGPEYVYDEPADTTPSCDPSYPDVCIPSYPPDLDCDDIFYSNFRVVGSDPHGFDRDNDGIGCEVGSPQSPTTPSCDPSYPDVCIAPYPPDLNCGDIGYSNFRVIGDDPHGFDGDNDGIGCES